MFCHDSISALKRVIIFAGGIIMECSLASVQLRRQPVHGYLHGHTTGGPSMLKKSSSLWT